MEKELREATLKEERRQALLNEEIERGKVTIVSPPVIVGGAKEEALGRVTEPQAPPIALAKMKKEAEIERQRLANEQAELIAKQQAANEEIERQRLANEEIERQRLANEERLKEEAELAARNLLPLQVFPGSDNQEDLITTVSSVSEDEDENFKNHEGYEDIKKLHEGGKKELLDGSEAIPLQPPNHKSWKDREYVSNLFKKIKSNMDVKAVTALKEQIETGLTNIKGFFFETKGVTIEEIKEILTGIFA